MNWISPPLASFLKVAELGHVSRAAEHLNLSQPAVTKQLRALELGLGVALVERAGRGIRLTPEGELVRDYARRSVLLEEECRAFLAESLARGSARLRLGAGVTTSIFQLPAWLAKLRHERPGTDVVVRTGTSLQTQALLLERELDLGLFTTPPRHAQLLSKVLFREEILLVAAPGWVEPRRRVVLEELALIAFPVTTGFRAYLDGKLGAARLSSVIKMESDSVEAIKSFTQAGLGAAFLPRSAVAAELAARSLRRLHCTGLPALERSTLVARRRDRAPGAAGAAFLRLIGAPSLIRPAHAGSPSNPRHSSATNRNP